MTLEICEAVDCDQEATETVSVSAGKFGFISLHVCHKCRGLFE